MNQFDSFDYSQITGVLRRRWAAAACAAATVFLLSVVIAALLPDRYEAWTTLLVEPQSVSPRLVDGGLQQTDLENRLHLMTMQILSRSRLSAVIEAFGLYPELATAMTREEVISKMRDDIRIVPVLPELSSRATRDIEINTFSMHYSSSSPKTAADVANRLANDFINEHIRDRVQVSGDTAEFIAAELASLSDRMTTVEAEIAAIKNENQGSLPADMKANQERLGRILQELYWAQRDVAVALSDEAFFRQQALTGVADAGRNAARPDTPADRKSRLELALGEYRSRGFTDNHPDVISAKAELELLQERIAGGAADENALSSSQTVATNEAKRAEIRGRAAREQIDRLRTQVIELEDRLARTPRVEEQLAALEREYEHLYQSYQEFSSKRREANVAADMERDQKGEQFRVLEGAFAPPSPSSPNRPLILLIGLFLGGLAGGSLALLLELMDSSFHGARDLQSAVPIPVLASIPSFLLPSERAALRRRRIASWVLAGSLTAVTLFGAGVGYLVTQRTPASVGGEAAPAGDAERTADG